MQTRPIEILLSEQQISNIQNQIYGKVSEAIERSSQSKTWMKWKDLVDYLPISNNAIRDHLQDLPFHIVGGTKFYNKTEVDKYLLTK
ncbi:hypothetical protein [Companilactobacillus zhachilii]|uniref:hypothetical protein n=1 Tax=Companilactobacillus zhachilii TaxID=2304606 RepID=UPI004033B9D9